MIEFIALLVASFLNRTNVVSSNMDVIKLAESINSSDSELYPHHYMIIHPTIASFHLKNPMSAFHTLGDDKVLNRGSAHAKNNFRFLYQGDSQPSYHLTYKSPLEIYAVQLRGI